MASFPKILVPKKYIRQNWDGDAYRYLSEFFSKAYFDTQVQVIPGASIDDYRNSGPEGGWALPCGTSAAATYYASYFRVVDASGISDCVIGVTSGASWSVAESEEQDYCGAVKVNGFRTDTPRTSQAIAVDGVYGVWIHSWVDAETGPASQIVFGTTSAPSNVNGGVAYANQLAGRVTVAGGVITSIVQDYLRGGEHSEPLWGDCDGAGA